MEHKNQQELETDRFLKTWRGNYKNQFKKSRYTIIDWRQEWNWGYKWRKNKTSTKDNTTGKSFEGIVA